jgi:hypothetical protein
MPDPNEQHAAIDPDGLTLRVRARSKHPSGDVHCAGVKLIARGQPYFNAYALERDVHSPPLNVYRHPPLNHRQVLLWWVSSRRVWRILTIANWTATHFFKGA